MKPFDAEHNRRSRELCAEKGYEMTIEELTAERKAAYATIRAEMKKKGYDMPESDEEMFLLLKEIYGDKAP